MQRPSSSAGAETESSDLQDGRDMTPVLVPDGVSASLDDNDKTPAPDGVTDHAETTVPGVSASNFDNDKTTVQNGACPDIPVPGVAAAYFDDNNETLVCGVSVPSVDKGQAHATDVHALNFDDTGRTQVPSKLTPNTNKSLPGTLALDAEEDGELLTINTVESLRRGFLGSSQMYPTPYTILVVGETGVGKSSVLEFIANVLKGNNTDQYDFNILDRSNERGGSDSESQTNEAKLYHLRSKNGMWVRILDTPGLADTRGLHQDDLHKKSIANLIKDNIDSVNAVLILANGTVPRITVGTDYALSTLSAIFPKSLTNNIAFMFTNVASPLSWNFSQDTVPPVLRGAPQFLLDNPISLQRKYLEMKNDPNVRKVRTQLHGAVREGEEKALGMLADFFDWVDYLEPQPTIEILSLYEKSQEIESKITDTLAQMDQAEAKKWEIDKLMTALTKESANMNAFANFEKTVNTPVWKRVDTTAHNTLCGQTNCYSNCHIGCTLQFSLDSEKLQYCTAMTKRMCHECNHGVEFHQHYRSKWEEAIDTQVTVDQDLKTKWEAAKTEKEAHSALVSAGESALRGFNQVIDRATNELARLADDYAGLSLSGSFSGQVEKAVKLLEQKYKGMEQRGVGQEQLQKVKESLDMMTKKLGLLRIANEKIKKDRGMRMPVWGGFRGQGQSRQGQGWHKQGQSHDQGMQSHGQGWPSHGQGWQSYNQSGNQWQGKLRDGKGWVRKVVFGFLN